MMEEGQNVGLRLGSWIMISHHYSSLSIDSALRFPILDPGSRILDPGSWIQGSRIQDSGYTDLGPGCKDLEPGRNDTRKGIHSQPELLVWGTLQKIYIAPSLGL